MVQAAACRAALYGFNSHPQLHGMNSYDLLLSSIFCVIKSTSKPLFFQMHFQ
jgi:hypothetical protein